MTFRPRFKVLQWFRPIWVISLFQIKQIGTLITSAKSLQNSNTCNRISLNNRKKLPVHQEPIILGAILEFCLSPCPGIIWPQLKLENSLPVTHTLESVVLEVWPLDLQNWLNLGLFRNAILKPTSDLLHQKLWCGENLAFLTSLAGDFDVP